MSQIRPIVDRPRTRRGLPRISTRRYETTTTTRSRTERVEKGRMLATLFSVLDLPATARSEVAEALRAAGSPIDVLTSGPRRCEEVRRTPEELLPARALCARTMRWWAQAGASRHLPPPASYETPSINALAGARTRSSQQSHQMETVCKRHNGGSLTNTYILVRLVLRAARFQTASRSTKGFRSHRRLARTAM